MSTSSAFVIKMPLNLAIEIPMKVMKFWECLRQGRILTTKCRKCSKVYFPPRADCIKCLSSDMEWIELSGEAELITYTVVMTPPALFTKYAPYTIAIVQLKEGPKAIGWLTDIEPKPTIIGMKLRAHAKETPEGKLLYDFKPLVGGAC